MKVSEVIVFLAASLLLPLTANSMQQCIGTDGETISSDGVCPPGYSPATGHGTAAAIGNELVRQYDQLITAINETRMVIDGREEATQEIVDNLKAKAVAVQETLDKYPDVKINAIISKQAEIYYEMAKLHELHAAANLKRGNKQQGLIDSFSGMYCAGMSISTDAENLLESTGTRYKKHDLDEGVCLNNH